MTNMFTVAKTSPIQGSGATQYGGTTTVINSNKCMTYNQETGQPLGVVGMDYQIMQPQECADIVSMVTGSDDINTVWDGRSMITTGPMSAMLLPGDDEVKTNFCVVNSWDGGTALSGFGTSMRLFCTNQLRTAFNKARNSRYSIRHSGNWDSKVSQFRQAMMDIKEGHSHFTTQVSAMVQTQVTQARVNELWRDLAPIALGPLPKDDAQATLKLNGYATACQATFNEEEAQGAPASLWLAANAVTKFIQHSVAKRGRKTDESRRFVDNCIGPRSTTTANVMRAALATV